MGRYVFKLPDIGEGMVEAEIAAWHVKVGDLVQEETLLVEVMTDKATVEIEAPVSGRVLALGGGVGERLPVGSELVVLETADDKAPAAQEPRPEPRPGPAPAPPPAAEPPAAPRQPAEAPPPEPAPQPAPDRVLAAPAVRRRAQQLGVDLARVPGSGIEGRISHDDLDRYITAGRGPAPAAPAGAPRDGVEAVRVIGLRRRIAERLQESKRRIPHFSYVEEVDVTALEELRRHLNEKHGATLPKLTLLPFLTRALARALPGWPQINARYDDEGGVVVRHAAVDVGIATQTEQGLVVPVLRHAEALSLWQAAAEIARLAAAARAGKATREELSGSTITITSLGALGGIATTPVINLPEVAILGVNRMVERPVVKDGQIVVRRMMNLSSSFDHRVVDGWDAAAFVQRIKELLEHPATLFLEEG